MNTYCVLGNMQDAFLCASLKERNKEYWLKRDKLFGGVKLVYCKATIYKFFKCIYFGEIGEGGRKREREKH